MPIETLQPRLRELGRIRIGQQVPTKGGKTRPAKLETFRLTSRSEALIREAASIFGGEAKPWHHPQEGDQWEVVTQRDWLDVLLVPPFDPAQMQWFELWSSDGPLRRCTGQFTMDGENCVCAEQGIASDDPDHCKPVTRMRMMIRGLSDVGIWLLTSSGYNAAAELPASFAVFAWLRSTRPVPVTLRLEQRTKKVAGGADHKFAVPVIEVAAALDRILESAGQDEMLQLVPADRPTKQLKSADLGDVDPEPSDAPDPRPSSDESASPEDAPPLAVGGEEGGVVELPGADPEDDPAPPSPIVEEPEPVAIAPATPTEIWRLASLAFPEKSEPEIIKLLSVAPESMTEVQLEQYAGMLRRKVERKGLA